MKATIILLSFLAMAIAWWWNSRSLGPRPRSARNYFQLVSRSFMAGLIVYFSFMALALIYLMITTA